MTNDKVVKKVQNDTQHRRSNGEIASNQHRENYEFKEIENKVFEK